MRVFHLDTTSDPARLAPARPAAEAFAISCGFDETTAGELGLVLNEAMANITRHAYQGATDRPVRIDAQFEGEILQLSIRDWGNGQDPSGLPPKGDLLTPGGLGMVCMRSILDEVRFQPQADGMLLTAKKKVVRGK